MNECANDLTDSSVGCFDDCVCCGSVGCNVSNFNSGVHECELEIVTEKFGSIVMYDFEGLRVSGEPVVLKECAGIFCIFSSRKTVDFDQIGNWVDAGESIEFEVDFVECNLPGANIINVYFGPRCDRGFAWGKVTMWFAGKTYFGTDLAVRNYVSDSFANFGVKEVLSDNCFKAVHTERMNSDFMVPTGDGM